MDFKHQVIYIVLMPLFFFCFSMLYNPFDILGYYVFGGFGPEFHLLMLSSIILLCIAVTRVMFWLISRTFKVTWAKYLLWCMGEIAAVSCFMSLYTTLFASGSMGYFQALADCVKFSALSLVYPYAFLMLKELVDEKSAELELKDNAGRDVLVKFRDEHQRLKLTIERNSVLYIRSDNNYLEIYYLSSGAVKQYLLRNSMKSQEENARNGGFVRCHRSCYVNPRHIKMLGKDKNGVYCAVLDTETPIEVPVSRQYYESLTKLL